MDTDQFKISKKKISAEEAEDILAEKLAYLFLEQIKRRKQNETRENQES